MEPILRELQNVSTGALTTLVQASSAKRVASLEKLLIEPKEHPLTHDLGRCTKYHILHVTETPNRNRPVLQTHS